MIENITIEYDEIVYTHYVHLDYYCKQYMKKSRINRIVFQEKITKKEYDDYFKIENEEKENDK
jgi:hypothetical protein